MTEISRRETEIPRREAEMYRVEAIQDEMALAIRILGGDGSAKEQNNRAARITGLSITTVERLRWKKIKRPFADITDMVRHAVDRHNTEGLKRAKHEAFLEKQRADILAARLMELDPDRFGQEVDALRRSADGLGRISDQHSGA